MLIGVNWRDNNGNEWNVSMWRAVVYRSDVKNWHAGYAHEFWKRSENMK